ncbi:MAG: DUF4430 domain-containing protein [Patescibacteria group bacterium]|nr:DUF4430 domain-containing protein [Patescibacteria group bacterium]
MTKKIAVLLILLAAYLAVTVAIQPRLRQVLRAPETTPPVSQNAQGTPSAQTQTPNLSYNCEPKKTAFDLLERAAKNQVEVKIYSFGKMITAINGVKNGTDGRDWIFFVDGKSATESADSYHCQDREKIEWRFIKPE